MASANSIARMADLVAGRAVASLDASMLRRIQSRTKRIIANSPYLMDLYRQRGIPVEAVVYTLKDLSEFQPSTQSPSRDYALL